MVILLAAGIILGLGLVDNTFRLVLLNRYSLLIAALLVGLVPLGLAVVPGILGNLFVLRSPWQLFNITWIAFLTAVMTVMVTRVVEVNAPDRYGTDPITDAAEVWGWARTLAVLLLAHRSCSLLDGPCRRRTLPGACTPDGLLSITSL